MLELQVAGLLEKLFVLGIGIRPATFNVIDSQLVEFLRDDQLVVERERYGFALRAVAESGVEGLDAHMIYFAGHGPAPLAVKRWRLLGGCQPPSASLGRASSL